MSKSVRLIGMVLVVAVALVGFVPSVSAKAVGPAFGGTALNADAKNQSAVSVPTIVGVALDVNAKTGEFSTLIAALKYLDLVGTLNNRNASLTVFAPTDAAFAALGLNAKNITSLPKSTLRNIVLYHVAPGRQNAARVLGRTSLVMLNGERATVMLKNGVPMIDNAKIATVNIQASNGIIHIIDAVILP